MKTKTASELITFGKSRIATIDVCELGRKKHHIAALLEIDVTRSREKIKKYKKETGAVSFSAWLIKVISSTISEYSSVAAFLRSKRSAVAFRDVSVSLAVEKEINGQKVPLPLLIEKANLKSVEAITAQINEAKKEVTTDRQVVIQKNASRREQLYYYLPGFARRAVWKYMLKHPGIIFSKMGNVAVTTPGMFGRINGWFIPLSVHPVCFGIGAVTRKPVVVNDSIEIREILNMTVLIDHDVIDGANMVRFMNVLAGNMENGAFLE